MSALNVKRPPDVNRPVPIDNIMVPDVLPLVVVYMIPADRFHSNASVDFRPSAMEHNFVQMSHIVQIKVRGIFSS